MARHDTANKAVVKTRHRRKQRRRSVAGLASLNSLSLGKKLRHLNLSAAAEYDDAEVSGAR